MATIRSLLKTAADCLEGGKTDTPVLDAELLLIHTFKAFDVKMDRIKLITQSNCAVDERIERAYQALVRERLNGKPVQYITRRQEFMGMELYVSEDVLIPRGDTEIALDRAISMKYDSKRLQIIDMCTGSGAIAVALAARFPDATVFAVDISPAALACARVNVEKFGLQDRIFLIEGDLFASLKGLNLENKIDIVISNPPYIPASEIACLEDGVKNYEPVIALDGGADGLDFYRAIIHDAASCLKCGSCLVLEIGYDQGRRVMNMIEASGFYTGVRLDKDLAGLDRCVSAIRL